MGRLKERYYQIINLMKEDENKARALVDLNLKKFYDEKDEENLERFAYLMGIENGKEYVQEQERILNTKKTLDKITEMAIEFAITNDEDSFKKTSQFYLSLAEENGMYKEVLSFMNMTNLLKGQQKISEAMKNYVRPIHKLNNQILRELKRSYPTGIDPKANLIKIDFIDLKKKTNEIKFKN